MDGPPPPGDDTAGLLSTLSLELRAIIEPSNKSAWCLKQLVTYLGHPMTILPEHKAWAFCTQQYDESLARATPPPQAPVNDAATQTSPPTPPPARTYVEAATQATAPPEPMGKGKGKEPPALQDSPRPLQGKKSAGPPTAAQSQKAPTPQQTAPPPEAPSTKRIAPTTQARAVVLHAAPATYKPSQMRRWIEVDNNGRA